jgi:SAM-dependent methyltransferase
VSASKTTYDLSRLAQSRAKWEQTETLRAWYHNTYEQMARYFTGPRVLEVGSGIGVMKSRYPEVTTSDVVKSPFVDLEVSAYAIPRAPAWDTVCAVDVLHHLERPTDFLASAAEALAPGGRIVLVEPAATMGGRLFYRLFHHEPMDLSRAGPPFVFSAGDAEEFSNMAIAYGMFERHASCMEPLLSESGLRLRSVSYRDLLAYPLTGGFSQPALVSPTTLHYILRIEKLLPAGIVRWSGLRMLVVLEKTHMQTSSGEDIR